MDKKRYQNHVEPFATGFLNADREDQEYRIACGIREYMTWIPLYIEPDQVFAGAVDRSYDNVGVHYNYGRCIWYQDTYFDKDIEEHPEWADELKEQKEKMAEVSSRDLVYDQMNEEERTFCKRRIGWGGAHRGWQGHSNPDFYRVPRLGTNGLRNRAEEYRLKNPGHDDFYDSLVIALDALDILAGRYRTLAGEMAEKAETPEDKERLMRMARALERVPKYPARTLYEACQAFWLTFVMDGIDSPGRFDQSMITWYREADEKERRYCLKGLWDLFHSSRTWNLCIGGSDADWNDESNELTYDILKLARECRYHTPNLTMRVHRNTPQDLWELATDSIATGIGMPALYNDECVCPAMEALGIPPEDAHDYCMNGCNQIDIFGKSHMGLEDGEICLAKCLELTLFNGLCGREWDLIGKQTGDPLTFDTFEKLMDAYKAQVEWAADVVTDLANRSQAIAAKYGPNPFRSSLIEGCVETATDYKNGGPFYGHGQILTEGIADTVDSLAAIKRLIYDEKRYTMGELIDALKKDFEGYDELYYDFSHNDKFGNDIAYVDAIYQEIMDHFYGYLLTKHTFRGGLYGGGCSTYMRAAAYGRSLGALPNGKKRDEDNLADSIGSVPGCDHNGPTALINSVLCADQTLAKSGNVMQLKFNKNLFNTKTGKQAFMSLAKTYFAGKGQQLSINVVSLEELLDAQVHPENHQDLIVRVGGYSDRFVRLEKGLQANIIRRTEQEM